jgi:hypothetical protein
LSLEGRELKGKSSILRRHGRMTAEEESRKTKQEQGEGWHRPRFLDYMVMKVKRYRRTEYWRTTGFRQPIARYFAEKSPFATLRPCRTNPQWFSRTSFSRAI